MSLRLSLILSNRSTTTGTTTESDCRQPPLTVSYWVKASLMKKVTKKRKSTFPLTLHPTGQWCKKIRGKLHYFGNEKQDAHRVYLEAASDLHAGRQLRKKIGAARMSVKDLAKHYLDFSSIV